MAMKTIAYAAPKSFVVQMAKDLKLNGYDVRMDRSAGTMVAYLRHPNGDQECIVRAMQMGRSGAPWSVRADDRVVTPISAQ